MSPRPIAVVAIRIGKKVALNWLYPVEISIALLINFPFHITQQPSQLITDHYSMFPLRQIALCLGLPVLVSKLAGNDCHWVTFLLRAMKEVAVV